MRSERMTDKYFRIWHFEDSILGVTKEGWLLQGRETNRHNWGFIFEGSLMDCFKHIPGTAGIDKDMVFKIEQVRR